ncbi:MAG: PKD domain-containing protein [Candidatus Aminicenantes bacterium]|nr:PKD domain-containing protein [Candidatus Aminicenantes bacterium]NIQ65183.1 PKD domain-containing protein [Candidatus Aminicenantes bacterium]NIT21186.1 PKD domain-containing protein [Candidatus Aminicenantes bacterium]
MMKRIPVFFIVTLVLLMFTVGSTCLYSKVQVGEEVLTKYQTDHPYKGEKGVVWEKTFHWPNAGYIAIHFAEFDLASDDYVEISSPDGRYVYTYKEKGKWVKEKGDKKAKQISEFWATHIPGDTVNVKLVSSNRKAGFGFVIDKWARGYEKGYIDAVLAGLEQDAVIEAICNADDKEWAKCYEGTEMYNKAKAVCRLLIGGTSACTGWLLGSEGHVMTNNHCISTQSSAGNTDYEFMAEGATCSTNCASWGACPGVVEASAGTLIKTNSSLDYTLILLPTNVTSTYGYLQLRDALPTIGERIYIPQHPGAWGKQLAVNSDTDGPFAKIYSTNEPPCIGGPGDIGYYADTAGGSSGSPVLAYNDHLVVSLHHCANCPNRGLPIPNIVSDLGADLPANAVGTTIPQPPVADFSADKTTVMVGSDVNFTDQSSYNPTSWSWTFEGGTPATSTAQNPTVTYNTLGTFDVTLTATNDLGSDTETKVDYITVTDTPIYCSSQGNTQVDEYIGGVQIADLNNTSGPSPYSDFTYLTANMTAGSTVNVTLTPVFTGTVYTEYWTIWIDYNYDGDFEDAGEEVFNDYGTTVITGSFTVQSGVDVVTRMRVTMKYGSYATPCETFTYGEVEDYTANITTGGNLPPIADFTYTTSDLTVNFTDTSTDPDGTVVGWDWNFGDGNTSTLQNPTHTYAAGGTYTVTLTVTDNDGATDSISKDVTVTEPGVEIYVYDITQTIKKMGKNYQSTAVVTIWDTNNNPVADATVTITWSGVVSGSDSGVTGADGTVSFKSDKVKSTGPFTITVDNVTHPIHTYNPALNNETSDTATY